MGYPVTWFEINTADPEKTAGFYAELFGWHTETVPDADYILIDTHSRSYEETNGINGGLGLAQGGQPAATTVYAEAPDIQSVLDKAESLGATVVLPVTESMEVTFALFADPFGNVIGLVQGDGSTRVSSGDNPPVTWFQIDAADARGAWSFYRDLFGWSIEESSSGQYVHGNVDTGSGQGISGGIGQASSGVPIVSVYAQVDDLQKYLRQAESLGATTIVRPTPVGGDTSIAVFEDPQGVAFGLFVHQH